ncbi:MAG: hypothetical protein V9F06_12520 [Thermomicrobiales bacterium]
MSRRWLSAVVGSLLALLLVPIAQAADTNLGDLSLSSSNWAEDSGNFPGIWDLTQGDMTISFTYDGNGLVDASGAHAWAELGVRSLHSGGFNFNPNSRYTYNTTTFDLRAEGSSTDVGDVTVSSDETNIYVKFVVNSGSNCTIARTRVQAGSSVSGFPRTWWGDAVPSRFNHQTIHSPQVIEYVYTISRSEVGDGDVYVAANAQIYCDTQRNPRSRIVRTCIDAWAGGVPFSRIGDTRYAIYDSSATRVDGSGVWFASDYDWTAGTFGPDPAGSPSLDIDDKFTISRFGGHAEGDYNLPQTPPDPWNNTHFWFDRDDVDQWQAAMWGMAPRVSYNTNGIYHVVITLHATSATAGTAYMTVNGASQGFYSNGWKDAEPEIYPAGMTFTGDMQQLQVFYGLLGYGATHSVTFSDITIGQ